MATERTLHRVFEASVLIKGAHALIELVTSLALAFVSTETIAGFVELVTRGEISEDPRDFIATRPLAWAHGFTVETKTFLAWYLLSHGVVKLVLVAGLLRNQRWAYPASILVLGLFIAYQVYRYVVAPELWLVLLTAFDLVVLVLIWHEYDLVRQHLPLA